MGSLGIRGIHSHKATTHPIFLAFIRVGQKVSRLILVENCHGVVDLDIVVVKDMTKRHSGLFPRQSLLPRVTLDLVLRCAFLGDGSLDIDTFPKLVKLERIRAIVPNGDSYKSSIGTGFDEILDTATTTGTV